MRENSPLNNEEQKTPPDLSSTALLLTLADTTWRMFVPSIGMTSLGLWLDHLFGTTPWIMFVCVVIGFLIAIYAVRLQLKKVK